MNINNYWFFFLLIAINNWKHGRSSYDSTDCDVILWGYNLGVCHLSCLWYVTLCISMYYILGSDRLSFVSAFLKTPPGRTKPKECHLFSSNRINSIPILLTSKKLEIKYTVDGLVILKSIQTFFFFEAHKALTMWDLIERICSISFSLPRDKQLRMCLWIGKYKFPWI